MDITFRPEAFLEGLQYMGLGMLGIFVAIGIIVLVTVLLNKVTK